MSKEDNISNGTQNNAEDEHELNKVYEWKLDGNGRILVTLHKTLPANMNPKSFPYRLSNWIVMRRAVLSPGNPESGDSLTARCCRSITIRSN